MVLSEGESSGVVTSPNYPRNYPLDVSCHYYVDGLVDKQNLEKVKLLFDDFNLPTVSDRSIFLFRSLCDGRPRGGSTRGSGRVGSDWVEDSRNMFLSAFLPRCMECSRGIAVRPSVPPSVRPSVCQTRAL